MRRELSVQVSESVRCADVDTETLAVCDVDFVDVRELIPEAVDEDEREAKAETVGVDWELSDCVDVGEPVRSALLVCVTLEFAVDDNVEYCDGDADEEPDTEESAEKEVTDEIDFWADALRVLVTVPVIGVVDVGLRDDDALNVGSDDRVGVFVEDDVEDVEPVTVFVLVSFADALELLDVERSADNVAVVVLLNVGDVENVSALLLETVRVKNGDVEADAVALLIAD